MSVMSIRALSSWLPDSIWTLGFLCSFSHFPLLVKIFLESVVLSQNSMWCFVSAEVGQATVVKNFFLTF